MGSRGPLPFLVGVLALVVGIALGAALAGRRAASHVEAAVPSGARATAPADELAPVLGELARALESLREALAHPPPSHATASRPVEREPAPQDSALPMTTADPASGDLAPALHALASALRDLGAGERSGAPGPRALVPPRWVDRAAAFADMGLREAWLSEDRDRIQAAEDAFRKQHFFWTTQQVLDRYGKPDAIEVNDLQNSWSYELKSGEQVEQYGFNFTEGLVYDVYYDLD